MQYRELGKTGLQVSALGFGGLGIGGGYGRRDLAEALRTVARALEHGINFFDTAPSYGASEELLGEALGGRRDQVIIATKAEGQGPDFIRESVERSLRRLRTETIDILQLRDPNPEKLERFDVVETFAALKREGKIRFGSVTVGDARQEPEALLSIEAGFDTIQLAYNMVFAAAASRVLPAAAQAKVGVIARGPLCKGFLTGRFRAVPADLKAHPNFAWWSGDEARTLLAIQDELGFLQIEGRRTLAQAAIQFVLRQPAIATTIPSLETVAEVDELAGALSAPNLTDADTDRIRSVVTAHPAVDY